MPHRVEKKRDDYFEVIYFFKWREDTTAVAIGSAQTQPEAEAIRDREDEFENLVSEKLDVAFTELRVLLEKKGLDNDTILNWIDTWVHEKRMYLIEIN